MSSTFSSDTLAPLPAVLQHGLFAVFCLGFISCITSSALFLYLSYKLFFWWRRGELNGGCNQFLLLIYNLVLADMQQAVAFVLTLVWLSLDKIDATSTTCFVEGWFVSVGDLASGVWIFAIALHTFHATIKGRRLPSITFFLTIAAIWIFVYALAIIGVAMHPRNFYVRAGAWCWINEVYGVERLWLHYFWIFVCMFGTIIVYIFIYVALQSRMRVRTLDSDSSLAPLSGSAHGKETLRRAAKYMALYPIIYTLCTLPLAAGRMAAMTGVDVSYWYYCLAGAAITSCGWLDVLLYACTRRVLVFSDRPPAPENIGIDTFGVINLSTHSVGLTTTIEGGLGTPAIRGHRRYGGMLSTLHTGRRAPISSPPRDDIFADRIDGVIMTKTTIEIASRPVTRDGQPEQEPLTGESSATSYIDTRKSSEPSRHPSWAGSWH